MGNNPVNYVDPLGLEGTDGCQPDDNAPFSAVFLANEDTKRILSKLNRARGIELDQIPPRPDIPTTYHRGTSQNFNGKSVFVEDGSGIDELNKIISSLLDYPDPNVSDADRRANNSGPTLFWAAVKLEGYASLPGLLFPRRGQVPFYLRNECQRSCGAGGGWYAANTTAGRELALSPWPANRGFIEGTVDRKFLMPGETFDRYGFGRGNFASPTGTPLEMRSLRPGTEALPYNIFQVVKPFEVNSGGIAPAFNQPGLGTQYELPVSIDILLKRRIIKKVP